MDYKYHGIILGKIDISETDRIYAIYTLESGKIGALAKGVKKPNAKLASALEPITYSEIFIARNRGKGKITGAICVDNFSRVKRNLMTLERVFYIFRVLNQLITQEEKDEEIFNLLLNYLKTLNKLIGDGISDLKNDILAFGFIFKLLKKLGYGIQTEKCVSCSVKLASGENYFSAERGGVLCANCSRAEIKKIKISDDSVKLIRIFFQNKIENFSKIKAKKKTLDNLKSIANEALRWIG